MRIGVIGAGFTGLSAAYSLLKTGHKVWVFEKDEGPGGLALGYQEKEWKWSLEKHFHHWFTNDKYILSLAKEINHNVLINRPKTSVYIGEKIYQLDSPLSVLKFPMLSILDRLRMGLIVAGIRYNPFWKPLEKYNATIILPKLMGQKSYKMIWEPLFKNKFGEHVEDVSLAWFWARIVKRTPSLAYPEGGFLNFANHLTKIIKQKGGNVHFNTEVLELSSDGKPKLKFKDGNLKSKIETFDVVIVTLPSFLFLKTATNLPGDYRKKFARLKGLGATNLVLRLNKPFLHDKTYWLNICETNRPIMAVVEHTNFMDKKYYDNEHLVYLGNYLPADSKRFSMNKSY